MPHLHSIGKGLGVGLAAVGRPAYINAGRADDLGDDRSVDALRRRTAEVLDAAYAGGIRYVDTARSYGRAEEFLADWLAARPEVTDVMIASKWGYSYVGEWRLDSEVHEVKEHSLAAFERQVEQTRGFLGERLGVYQIHSLTPESPALADEGLHEALGRLRDRGVRVGFSTSGPKQADAIRRGLAISVGGAPLFTVVQSTWNLLEPSAAPALAEAAAAGAEIVVKECLANGRLVAGGPDEAPGAGKVAQELGLPLEQLAFAVALAQPWVSRVLTGAVTTGQITDDLAAAALPAPFPPLPELAENPEAYWSARSARAWA